MLVPPNTRDLRPLVDLVLIEPAVTRAHIDKLCRTAIEHKVHGVCVNSSNVVQAYVILEDHGIQVICTVGFPSGAMDADAKRYETEIAADFDAHEIEAVLNIGRLKDRDHQYILRELRDIAEAADERPVNVVIEADLLTAEEQKIACDLILDSGAKGISTHTGFNGRPSAELLRTLRAHVGEKFILKASPITDLNAALTLIEAGASRVGIASGPLALDQLAPRR